MSFMMIREWTHDMQLKITCWPPVGHQPRKFLSTQVTWYLFSHSRITVEFHIVTTGCPLRHKKKIFFMDGHYHKCCSKLLQLFKKKQLDHCAQGFPLVPSALPMWFEVLTALLLKIYVFWDILLCCRINTIFTWMQDDLPNKTQLTRENVFNQIPDYMNPPPPPKGNKYLLKKIFCSQFCIFYTQSIPDSICLNQWVPVSLSLYHHCL
jgi:hypothetical protein